VTSHYTAAQMNDAEIFMLRVPFCKSNKGMHAPQSAYSPVHVTCAPHALFAPAHTAARCVSTPIRSLNRHDSSADDPYSLLLLLLSLLQACMIHQP
jgi:hypothetical protein